MEKPITMLILLMSVFTSYSQWIVPDSSHVFTSLSTDGTNLYAASIDASEPYIYKSTDQGNNWSVVYPGFNLYTVTMCYQGKVYIASNRIRWSGAGGMRKSTNGGLNWIPINIPLSEDSLYVNNMFGFGTQIFAGCYGGLWRSPNAGYDWFKMLTSRTTEGVTAIGSVGSRILCSVNNKLYRTTNNGYNWDSSAQTIRFTSFTSIGNVVYGGVSLGSGWGVWKSTDEGMTWARTGGITLPNVIINTIVNSGGMLIAGGRYLYVSTDNGDNWIKSYSEMATWKNLVIENDNIYTVNESNDLVYRNTLNNVIGLEQLSTVTPKNYQLSQNYPNPFNPQTHIEFAIQRAAHVNITVYDLLGKVVTVLANEQLEAGKYKTEWNAQVTTGVYFYTLTTSDFTETKKMMLIK